MAVKAGVIVPKGKGARAEASTSGRAKTDRTRRRVHTTIDDSTGTLVSTDRSTLDALVDHDHLLRLCADVMVEGLVLQDICGNIRFCNRSAEHILGATSGDYASGLTPAPFLSSVDEDGVVLPASRNPINQTLQDGVPVEAVVMGVRRPDGGRRWLEVNARPVFEAGAEPIGVVSTFVDITGRRDAERRANEQLEQIRCLNAMMKLQMRELEKANEQLEALAAHDGLTGLKNHRSFHERLASEVEYARRRRRELSVILLDVDHFKLYNDTFGHPAGDTVLRKLAEILSDNARVGDVVARSGRRTGQATIARHGGEEFSIILPNVDVDAAVNLAQRQRKAIENAEWPNRPVTASFGVASLSTSTADPTAIIAAADKALYESKTRGRNRVTAAD